MTAASAVARLPEQIERGLPGAALQAGAQVEVVLRGAARGRAVMPGLGQQRQVRAAGPAQTGQRLVARLVRLPACRGMQRHRVAGDPGQCGAEAGVAVLAPVGVQMGIHKVARDTGVLNLIPNAGVLAATRALCAPNVFRASYTNSQPTLGLGKAMVERGHKKAVWISWKYAAGDEAFEGFKQSYTAAGGTIVKELGLPFPNVEFQALLTEIAALKPDAVASGQVGAILQRYEEAGLRVEAMDLRTIDGDFGFKSDKEYQNLLDFGDGIMATIEIPSIGVDLPVRHGADAYALENGAGHLHGTSLPVGGQSTHSVITGHTGVADKALFTRLTELRKGDVFYVRVAAQTLAYKVERIRKVDPDDLRDVRIQPGRDLVTLVTCTPIFLNTYRLLVTGERVSMPDDAPYPEDAPRTTGRDARPLLVSGVALLAGMPVAMVESRPRVRPYGRHGMKR